MKWLLYIICILFFNKISFIKLNCTKPSFQNLTVQLDFNLNKFLGIWYEIKWLPKATENESDIWRNFYQIFQLENSSTQQLIVSGRARLLNNQTCFSISSWIINTNNSAKMILEKQDINSINILNWPYYILTTDYDHYALIYACTSMNYTYINPCNDPILWLFSRTISLSIDYSINLDQYIENILCINLTQLEITPQDGISCYSSSSSLNNIDIINLILVIFLLYI